MDINNKIEVLKSELKKLDPITEKRFKTSKELEAHFKKYESEYKKANDLEKQIEQLKWKLMTPEEQKEELAIVEKMKLKREGKL